MEESFDVPDTCNCLLIVYIFHAIVLLHFFNLVKKEMTIIVLLFLTSVVDMASSLSVDQMRFLSSKAS